MALLRLWLVDVAFSDGLHDDQRFARRYLKEISHPDLPDPKSFAVRYFQSDQDLTTAENLRPPFELPAKEKARLKQAVGRAALDLWSRGPKGQSAKMRSSATVETPLSSLAMRDCSPRHARFASSPSQTSDRLPELRSTRPSRPQQLLRQGLHSA